MYVALARVASLAATLGMPLATPHVPPLDVALLVVVAAEAAAAVAVVDRLLMREIRHHSESEVVVNFLCQKRRLVVLFDQRAVRAISWGPLFLQQ